MRRTTARTHPNRNPQVMLDDKPGGQPLTWVRENTAIFVVHGIGNQLPMETLEQFGKTLIKTYGSHLGTHLFTIEHRLRTKKADAGDREWYDNYLRIRCKGSPCFIDLYEYYWAHYTEGKADWSDISKWLQGITSGARRFYRRNTGLSATLGDNSLLTSSRIRYFLFLNVISRLLLLLQFAIRGLANLLSHLPVLGGWVESLIGGLVKSTAATLANVIGDLVAYSVTDAKSKYYPVRRAILDGCVKALLYLMEHGLRDSAGALIADDNKQPARTYPRILVAGHSLGSVIAYDTLNRINLMINQCLVDTYHENGDCRFIVDAKNRKLRVSDQLRGFITFGSPLDKVAFFLRENIPDEQFVRQQLLNHFMNFKQYDWTPSIRSEPGFFEIRNKATSRLLEEMPWRNYYDQTDYVSGDLDYYGPLVNVDCRFHSSSWISFTHSSYWNCTDFYRDIIRQYLS